MLTSRYKFRLAAANRIRVYHTTLILSSTNSNIQKHVTKAANEAGQRSKSRSEMCKLRAEQAVKTKEPQFIAKATEAAGKSERQHGTQFGIRYGMRCGITCR